MRPNVLLLVLDTARRDAFEPYGAMPGSSSAIAQVAARGRALPEVYATAPWTVPSHMSLLSGLMPRAAGLTHVPSLAAAKATIETHRPRLLAEVLRQAGYRTYGVSTNPWASDLSGLAAGFDEFTLLDTERQAWIPAGGRRARYRWLKEGALGRVDDGAREAERALGRYIGERPARPFFCFVNLNECHSPYLPPRAYGRMSRARRVLAAEDAHRYWTLEAMYRVCGRALDVPEGALRRARKLYGGAIRYMDDWIARLLERLEALRVLEETLVIITADHGENFGEDHLIGHMLSLDDRLIHVPFVAAGPGAEQLELNSLASLPACIAEAIGLPGHPWRDGPPAGVGVAQSEPVGRVNDPRTPEKLAENGIVDEIGRARLTTPLSCAVRDGLKLVRRGSVEELFDTRADPLEVRPVAPGDVEAGRQPVIAELRAALDHPTMALREHDPTGAPDAAAGGVADAEKRDLEQRMKLLGYM